MVVSLPGFPAVRRGAWWLSIECIRQQAEAADEAENQDQLDHGSLLEWYGIVRHFDFAMHLHRCTCTTKVVE